jgi:hypothetical protein
MNSRDKSSNDANRPHLTDEEWDAILCGKAPEGQAKNHLEKCTQCKTLSSLLSPADLADALNRVTDTQASKRAMLVQEVSRSSGARTARGAVASVSWFWPSIATAAVLFGIVLGYVIKSDDVMTGEEDKALSALHNPDAQKSMRIISPDVKCDSNSAGGGCLIEARGQLAEKDLDPTKPKNVFLLVSPSGFFGEEVRWQVIGQAALDNDTGKWESQEVPFETIKGSVEPRLSIIFTDRILQVGKLYNVLPGEQIASSNVSVSIRSSAASSKQAGTPGSRPYRDFPHP